MKMDINLTVNDFLTVREDVRRQVKVTLTFG